MFKTKRKRAVVLALIVFFCTAAVTYVAVDWRRFGGGFLAFLKGRGEPQLASSGGHPADSGSGNIADGATSHASSLPLMAAAVAHTKRPAGASGGSGHRKADDDLFAYGNPAAGGIPPGNFIVAQNDTPSGGGSAPSPGPSGVPESGGTPDDGGGVSSPAPAPTTGNGGPGDSGLPGTGKTPTPAPSPTSAPPASTPPAPTPPPPPTQSGTTDSDPPPPPPPTDAPPPPASLPPVSAVPEASSLAMMSLGALFLAVAAQRKRKNG